MSRAFLALALLLAAVSAALLPAPALAIERNFAGSIQLDYHLVPTQKDLNGRAIAFDGFTTEAAVKVVVDVSDHLSANVKLCFGCHGFELNMGYLDYRFGDALNIRAGRFSPSFGAFNLRHDPANHRLSDKPLPYDMGRMLRLRQWNMGVLPSPFPDNGLEVNGTHWFGGDAVQLDYAAYAVMGFRGDASGFDLDWIQSRSLYYVDNNARPTTGARLAATFKLAPTSDMTVGASGMYGTFDPENRLSYAIAGADLSFRIDRTNIRAEYLVRRQEFDTRDITVFRFEIPPKGGDFFMKHGAFVELEQPLSKSLDLALRVDGLYRAGNVLGTSELSRSSGVVRYTLGTTFALERGLRIKGSTSLWQFTDKGANGNLLDLGFHLSLVGTL